MSITPDWAPNIHPLVVHFPIALLIIAVLVDFFSLLLIKQQWLRKTGNLLYVIAAVSTVSIYFTGRSAADSVMLPALAYPVLTQHADYATLTVWYYSIFALIRLGFQFKFTDVKKIVYVPLFLVGFAGLFLVIKTAENGGMLVYKYGVGISETSKPSTEVEKVEIDKFEDPGIVFDETGSWTWDPVEGAEKILAEQFIWLENSFEQVNPDVISDSEKGSVLVLHPNGKRVMFTAGNNIKSIQADVALNISEFTGTFMIVHHVKDIKTFDFVSLENRDIKLGRLIEGREKIHDEKKIDADGWINVRVVADGSHFRGYINEKLLTHGHGNELPPGRLGFRIEGTGTIYMQKIRVQSLR